MWLSMKPWFQTSAPPQEEKKDSRRDHINMINFRIKKLSDAERHYIMIKKKSIHQDNIVIWNVYDRAQYIWGKNLQN
jgi:hypothetical protein